MDWGREMGYGKRFWESLGDISIDEEEKLSRLLKVEDNIIW
jgi:hypothetical protein